MKTWLRDHMADWNAKTATASQAADEAHGVVKHNYCYACEMRHPCLCDYDRIAAKMRAHYKLFRRARPGDNRPDPLMRDLLDIALKESAAILDKTGP